MRRSRWGKTRKYFKRLKTSRKVALASAAALIILAAPALITRQDLNYSILLNTIAKGESKGNYNAYFGHSNNTSIKFTAMTVGQVLAWQKDYVAKGSPSSAVGKYQIIRPTLESLVHTLKIDPETRFDEKTQDRFAIALLEKRGVKDYARGKISREQFANNLSKEWAALPKATGDKPDDSYYAGDGLNKVQVSKHEVFSSIETLDK